MNNKKMKKAAVLLLSGLVVVGASAWLYNSTTQSNSNKVEPGHMIVEIQNEVNPIDLTENDAIPMTGEWAIANITPYEFEVANVGDVGFDYELYLTDVTCTFPEGYVDILLSTDGGSTFTYIATLEDLEEDSVSVNAGPLATGTLQVGDENDAYMLIAYLDPALELADYTGNAVSFKVKAVAEQYHREPVNPVDPESLLDISSLAGQWSIVSGEVNYPGYESLDAEGKAGVEARINLLGLTMVDEPGSNGRGTVIELSGEDLETVAEYYLEGLNLLGSGEEALAAALEADGMTIADFLGGYESVDELLEATLEGDVEFSNGTLVLTKESSSLGSSFEEVYTFSVSQD